jgi:hypothetical protein
MAHAPLAISTVGYGEITPSTFFGRLVTIPLLIFGLLLIALPTFVLGREFSLVWDIMSQQEVCLTISVLIRSPIYAPV